MANPEILQSEFLKVGYAPMAFHRRDYEPTEAKLAGIKIKEGEAGEDAPGYRFMEELWASTTANPFYDRERVYKDESCVECVYSPNFGESSVSLYSVRALTPREGAGTRAMQFVCALADKHGVEINLNVVPLITNFKGPGKAKLTQWYKKFGFKPQRGGMVRPAVDQVAKQAGGSAPREYPVQKRGDDWYVVGLPGEELAEESTSTVSTSDSWLNVHQNAKNLDLAEQLFRELYAEFSTNDNLKSGDTFSTPIGQFLCDGVDVVPYDDTAKRAIAEVDESYQCECGCDQGKHLKKYNDNGFPFYAECSDHPQCKVYTRRGGG